jgi:transitional endoplasmic reticulum ATPase
VADDLTLTVTLRPAALDARRGIVRLHPEVMNALAVNPGDPLRLVGTRTTAGIAARAEPTASKALLYADDLWATSACATAARSGSRRSRWSGRGGSR